MVTARGWESRNEEVLFNELSTSFTKKKKSSADGMLPNNVNICNVGNIKKSSNDKLNIIFYYDFLIL